MTTIEQVLQMRFDSAALGAVKDFHGCGPIKVRSTIPTNRFERFFNLEVVYEGGEFRLGWVSDFYPVKVKLNDQAEPVYTVSRVLILLLGEPHYFSRLDKLLPYRPTITLHAFNAASVETDVDAPEEVMAAALPHKEGEGVYSIGWTCHRDLEDQNGDSIVFQDVENALLAAKYANNLTKVHSKQPALLGLGTNFCISSLAGTMRTFQTFYHAPKLNFFGWAASRLFGFPFESTKTQDWEQRLGKATSAIHRFVSRALWGTNGKSIKQPATR